jgi:hypothetical protein
MKFSLVFDNSGDVLPFEVVYNHKLFEYFVNYSDTKLQNSFLNHQTLFKELDKKITHLHWAVSKTNEVLYSLVGKSFEQQSNLENYLNQDFLNKTHCDWVFSQLEVADINKLRFSDNSNVSLLGWKLHELYPDEIRIVKTSELLEKLGYIYPYEEVNMGVHRIESAFNKTNLEFNPYIPVDISTDVVIKALLSYKQNRRFFVERELLTIILDDLKLDKKRRFRLSNYFENLQLLHGHEILVWQQNYSLFL